MKYVHGVEGGGIKTILEREGRGGLKDWFLERGGGGIMARFGSMSENIFFIQSTRVYRILE